MSRPIIDVLRSLRGGAMTPLGKIKAIAPAEPPEGTLMFPIPEGNLLSEDSRQTSVNLKTVPEDPIGDLKTAS